MQKRKNRVWPICNFSKKVFLKIKNISFSKYLRESFKKII